MLNGILQCYRAYLNEASSNFNCDDVLTVAIYTHRKHGTDPFMFLKNKALLSFNYLIAYKVNKMHLKKCKKVVAIFFKPLIAEFKNISFIQVLIYISITKIIT